MSSETKTVSTLNITFQDEFNQLDYVYKLDNPSPNITQAKVKTAYQHLFDNDLMYNKSKKQVAIYDMQLVTVTTTKSDIPER